MSDERGPDELVELVAKAVYDEYCDTHGLMPQWSIVGEKYQGTRDKFLGQAKIVLAALEPVFQQREREAGIGGERIFASRVVNDLAYKRDASRHPLNRMDFDFAYRYFNDRWGHMLDAATTDTAADRTEGGE